MKRIHNIIDNINNTIMGIQLIGDKKNNNNNDISNDICNKNFSDVIIMLNKIFFITFISVESIYVHKHH